MWKIQSKIFMLVCLFVLFFGHNVLAQEQVVTPNPVGQTADANQPVSIDVMYSTANPVDETLTGLGLRIHWDDSKLTFSSLTNVLALSKIAEGTPEADSGNYDGDANTDMFVQVAWADPSGNWPGTTPAQLYTANFTTAAAFSGSTQINFSASSTAAGRTLDPTSATITKTATDPGTLQFSSATYSVNEGGGTAAITVTRTGGSSGAVSVDYATSDGTATSGVDYTSASGTLNWSDGDSSSKTFNVPITQDGSVEGDETINLTLSNPGGGAVLGANTAVLTILDDDGPGTLELSSATYSVNEGGGTAAITVTRTGGSSGAVSVDYATSDGTATSGVDYTSASGTLNWSDGDSSSKIFNIPIIDDPDIESTETVNLSLNNPIGGAILGRNTAVLTIADNDGAPPAAVPTMTEWGMIILTLLIGLGSVYYLKRKQTI